MELTNKDYLFSLPNEELAQYLVHTTVLEEGDYYYDGEDEYYVPCYNEYYVSPASEDIYCDTQAAIEDTVKWLEAKHEESTD